MKRGATMHAYMLRRGILSILTVALLTILLTDLAHCQAPAVPLPDAPRRERVIDHKFLAVMGIEALAKSADMMTTAKHMGQLIPFHCKPGWTCGPQTPQYIHEIDPLFGRNPSNARLAGESAAIFAGETVLTYYLKKHHVKVWWLPAVASIAEHSTLAWHNTRL